VVCVCVCAGVFLCGVWCLFVMCVYGVCGVFVCGVCVMCVCVCARARTRVLYDELPDAFLEEPFVKKNHRVLSVVSA